MATPKQILKTYYGYPDFRPLQQEIIEQLLIGKDTLVLMPTGGRKVTMLSDPGVNFGGCGYCSLAVDLSDERSGRGFASQWNSSRSA